ncbi:MULTISPECIES: hypothetical protein [unclassified Spiroplasma]|uniref:hypothetical protein n=1 Tax=unclassified Spiroplasma TaxID=2637901 RepID=UPI0030CBFD43
MPWEPHEKWSTKDKDSLAKKIDEVNNSFGKEKERERREKVADTFESNKNKNIINDKPLVNIDNNAITKVAKCIIL